MADAVKKEEKKGPLGKLKEVAEDKEEQLQYLATLIRVIVLVWSAGILTLNYVQFPGLSKQDNIDPTFIASVFTGVLATFGVEAGQRKKSAASGGGSANVSKKDMEMLIEKATQAAPAQTIRIEQAPMVLAPSVPPKKG